MSEMAGLTPDMLLAQKASSIGPFLEVTMPLNFFESPSALGALAYFSTTMRTTPKRMLLNPRPAPIVRSDLQRDITRKAQELRLKLPTIARKLQTPKQWEELWFFFDAYEVWVEGAAFLFYVINYMALQNAAMDKQEQDEKDLKDRQTTINEWAREWIECNRPRVTQLPISADLIALFDAEAAKSAASLTPVDRACLKEALRHHHEILLNSVRECGPESRQLTAVQQQMPGRSPIHFPPQVHQIPHGSILPQPCFIHPEHLGIPFVPGNIHPYNNFMEGQRYLNNPNSHNEIAHNTPGFHSQKWRAGARSNTNAFRGNREKSTGQNQGHGLHNRSKFSGDFEMHRGKIVQGNSASSYHDHGPVYMRLDPRAEFGEQFSPNPGFQRNISNPPHPNFGRPNDARLWNPRVTSENLSVHASKLVPSDGSHAGESEQKDTTCPPTLDPPEPRVHISGASTTHFYKNGHHKDFENSTLHVSGAGPQWFQSHLLYHIASRYGPVEKISYCHPRADHGHGSAFITFSSETDRDAALIHLPGFVLPDGMILKASLAQNRSRSGSQSSHSSLSQQRPRTWSQQGQRHGINPRQASFSQYSPHREDPHHTSAIAVQNESVRPSNSSVGFSNQLKTPFKSGRTPAEDNYSELNPVQITSISTGTTLPLNVLADYTNTSPRGQKDLENEPRVNKKENIQAYSDNQGSPATIFKTGNVNGGGSRFPKSKKKRGSKQNTSTLPSPATTPVKSRSIADLNELGSKLWREAENHSLMSETNLQGDFDLKEPLSTAGIQVDHTSAPVAPSTAADGSVQSELEPDGSISQPPNNLSKPKNKQSKQTSNKKKKSALQALEDPGISVAANSLSCASSSTISQENSQDGNHQGTSTSVSNETSQKPGVASQASDGIAAFTDTMKLATAALDDEASLLHSPSASITGLPQSRSVAGSNASTPRPNRKAEQFSEDLCPTTPIAKVPSGVSHKIPSKSHDKNEGSNGTLSTPSINENDPKFSKASEQVGSPQVLSDTWRSTSSQLEKDVIKGVTSTASPTRNEPQSMAGTYPTKVVDSLSEIDKPLSVIGGRKTQGGPKNPNAVVPAVPLNMGKRRSSEMGSTTWPIIVECARKMT